MKVKVTQLCLTLGPYGLYSPWNSPGQNTGVGSLSLLQGIFPTQGSNPGLPHCRGILYKLSPKGSPRILDWIAYPFSRGSSWARNQSRVSCIAGGFFINWAIREPRESSFSSLQKSFSSYPIIHFLLETSPVELIFIHLHFIFLGLDKLWYFTICCF